MNGRYHSDESGSVAIVFALALLPTALAVGAAIDYSRASLVKTNLQSALDAAVLAAADGSIKTSEWRVAVGKRHFKSTASVAAPPSASFTVGRDTVSGQTTYAVPTAFMGIAGQDSIAVTVAATARIGSEGVPCILLLEPWDIALTINSYSQLKANCGVHVNSKSYDAIYVNSYGKILASSVCVTGGYQMNSGGTSTPVPKKGCPTRPDPLAGVPEPSYGACDHTDLVVEGGQAKTLSPGVYCKKLEIQNSATVNLKPGHYFFPDAELIVNAGGKLIGDGVMLYFNQDNGRLNANSKAQVQLKAPTSGTYAGIVLFQSRASSSWSAPPHIVNSDSSSYLQGSIYVPNGKIMLNSDSTLNQVATYTLVIARTMELNSYGIFVANANFNGATPLPGAISAASARQPVLIK